jgi:plastocyanin
MDGDDFCAKNNKNAVSETLVVNGGTLQNVIVYVKEGLKNSFDPSAEPAVLDQKDCQYTPHVLSLQVKQQIKIVTSDDTTHNVHPQPKNNAEWNKSQPPKGDPLLESFARAEVIPVKCNQHAWMKAFIGVFNHPFHAVTDKDGNYTIKGLPTGEYTIEAWHERLGTASQKVTVKEGETATLDFTSGALKAEKKGGLKLGTALIISCCGPGHELHK